MNRILPSRPSLTLLASTLLIATALFVSAHCRADEVFPVAHTEPITVRVLSGKDSRPLPRMHVVLTAGYDRNDLDVSPWRQEAITDDAGTVQLTNSLRNLPWLRVAALKSYACAPGADHARFSVELIRRDGMSADNRCGATVTETTPGQLTVYVSDLDPWRKFSKKSAKKAVRQLQRRARRQEQVEAVLARAGPVETKPKQADLARTTSVQAPQANDVQTAGKPVAPTSPELTDFELTEQEMSQLLAEQP